VGAGPTEGLREEHLRSAEWTVAGILTALALGLHLTFFTHAGALWRDEANSAALATTLSPRESIEALSYDSFPLLPTLVLRGWSGLGWGGSDAGFRVFGLLVGIASLGLLWLAARRYGSGPPLLSLALVGVSPLVVISVDSVRPYGMGVVAMGLTTLLIGRFVAAPSRGRFVAAAAGVVASVQCLYQNAFLLLAVGIAAIAAAPARARRPVTLGILGVGGLAALSLLPYAGSIREVQAWSDLARGATIDIGRVLVVLWQALDYSGPLGVWAWAGIYMAVAWALARSARQATEESDSTMARFGGIAAWAGVTLFLAAMAWTRLITQPWYYVPLLALAAPGLEGCVQSLVSGRRARVGTLVIVLAIAVSGAAGWRSLFERRTNIDRVAEYLESHTVAGDAITVAPWYFGISFHRYYEGPVPWGTLPPLRETRIHRFDLLKAAMRDPDPLAPLLHSWSRVLDSGHRVWLVVDFPPDPAGRPRIIGSPAWSFLTARADTLEVIPLGLDQPIQALERAQILVVSGRPTDTEGGSQP
jgi:hypothetical protein